MNDYFMRDDEIDVVRLKDIIAQLADVIFILCNAKKLDSTVILTQLTNLSMEERERFNTLICK